MFFKLDLFDKPAYIEMSWITKPYFFDLLLTIHFLDGVCQFL
jgi:hypothetical protein